MNVNFDTQKYVSADNYKKASIEKSVNESLRHLEELKELYGDGLEGLESLPKSSDYYQRKKVVDNLGLGDMDMNSTEFFEALATKIYDIWASFEDRAPEVEALEGSLWDKMMTGTLSEGEKELLNDMNGKFIPQAPGFDAFKERSKLLKTISNMGEFLEAWNKIVEANEEKWWSMFEQVPSPTQNEQSSLRKPIQAKSSAEIYKEEVKTNFWLSFLETQKEDGVNVLELIQRLNAKDIKA